MQDLTKNVSPELARKLLDQFVPKSEDHQSSVTGKPKTPEDLQKTLETPTVILSERDAKRLERDFIPEDPATKLAQALQQQTEERTIAPTPTRSPDTTSARTSTQNEQPVSDGNTPGMSVRRKVKKRRRKPGIARASGEFER